MNEQKIKELFDKLKTMKELAHTNQEETIRVFGRGFSEMTQDLFGYGLHTEYSKLFDETRNLYLNSTSKLQIEQREENLWKADELFGMLEKKLKKDNYI